MPKTLLLADDSVTIQKVVGITFANEDVELVTVDNGDDALTRARQVKPDLVLADIGMPGLNGYELCAAIRRDPHLSQIPVLLLTGTFETYDEQKAREVGASGHIAKPFEAQALVDRVFQLLAQAAPKAVPLPPKPAAPPASQSQTAPPTPRPAPAAPPTPQPVQRPVGPPATAPVATPRARPELPPVPNAPPARPAPSPAVAAPPTPTPRPAPKRESQPFEFELPEVPAKPAAPTEMPSGAAALADQEPVWEAEPEAEVLSEESPLDLQSQLDTPAPDATRLFAPDLLGRSTQLPDVPEPPQPPLRKADFSFDDLSFEEPTSQSGNQSQIFGETSDRAGSFEPEFAQPIPDAPLEVEALADPLYSQTTFLDPARERASAPNLDSAPPAPAAAPPLPDLLGGNTPAPHDPLEDELELAEAETALDDEPIESPSPLAKPFSPDTAAALDSPSFQHAPARPARPPVPPARAEAATRLMLQDEDSTPTPSPLKTTPPPARVSPPASAPRAVGDTQPRRAPVTPSPSLSASRPSAIVDSTLLSQSVEKVAWEAFGSLSEQVVNEVLKRVEAVVWEVVPQLCERLIREEIARLKREMSE